MSGKVVYARAKPEAIRITETYTYEQELSRNPKNYIVPEPAARIEVTLPYDGYEFFTRQAFEDVKQQFAVKGTAHMAETASALVGHLSFCDYGRTNLGKVLDLRNHYGSAPLLVPVAGQASISLEQLVGDAKTCVLEASYEVQHPEVSPIAVEMELLDEDILDSESFLESAASALPSSEQPDDSSDAWSDLAQQVNFRRNLMLRMVITLDLPGKLVRSELLPVAKRVSVRWPTVTSFETVHLFIEKGDAAEQESPLKYDPVGRSLEWRDVPFGPPESSSGTDLHAYRSAEMLLWIEQPGELYQQESLDGEVEVDISDWLFSGLGLRVFDGTGGLQYTSAGANASSTGNWPPPTRITHLRLRFRLILDDAFARRTLSPQQHLHFDEVIPEKERVHDILTALDDRGFYVERKYPIPSSPDALRYGILARRSEGPDTMVLWLLINGRRYKTERQTKVPGGLQYTSPLDSGEMQVDLRGQLPGNSRVLIQEMNALQSALRNRFERQKAKR
jgi:hypothetical protein